MRRSLAAIKLRPMKKDDAAYKDLNERLQALELSVGFQERTLAKLDSVLTAFTARVEELEREAKRLREHATQNPPPVGPHADPPPHW